MDVPEAITTPDLITLRAVGKSYPLLTTTTSRLKTLTSLLLRRSLSERFVALDDITLSLRKGESLGLIGVNGAGKSTLLKIIAGVVKPTTGTVSVTGRISALLELGAGFHPDYTGRQNVYLSTALMGFTESQTNDRLDTILSFADIGDHIDQPVKHYSSGMVVRLGFAISTAVSPEVLITDEVLAVGDEAFQRKCVTWMESYLANGGTLLLCSHSMFHIQKMCQKAGWIHQGRLRAYGDSHEVTRKYLAWNDERNAPKAQSHAAAISLGTYALLDMSLNDLPAKEGLTLGMGDQLRVAGRLHSPDGRPPTAVIGIVRKDGMPVYGVASDMDGYTLKQISPHEYSFALAFDGLPLLPGDYLVKGHAMDPEGYRLFDELNGELTIAGQSRELGCCRLAHYWSDG